MLRQLTGAVAAAVLLTGLATTTASAASIKAASAYTSCPAGTDYCRHDTGWESYDGGCQARTVLEFYRQENTMRLTTEVSDPYWFVACRVNAEVDFRDDAWEKIPATGLFPSMACAVLDPTCASHQTHVHQAEKATVRKRDAADVRWLTVIHHKG